jgi:hypothetical protein
MTFQLFSQKVNYSWKILLGLHELFVVDIDKDEFWAQYLASFPEGTNEIFRKRTEHDCSCCRNFLKNVGPVVSVKDGVVYTVWDEAAKLELEPYRTVAFRMKELVSNYMIRGLFRTNQHHYGQESNYDKETTKKWHHLFAITQFTRAFGHDAGSAVSSAGSSVTVFRRGLEELSSEAIETVIDLIEENQLYRGGESELAVRNFYKLWKDYRKLNSELSKNRFLWENFSRLGARIRNTSIGTLLVDLSSGVELTKALKSYDVVVAPENYQRPKSVITKSMLDGAIGKLDELGVKSAVMNRRFASLADLSAENLLFVNNKDVSHLKDDLFLLMEGQLASKSAQLKDKGTKLLPEQFIQEVLPKTKQVSVLFDNKVTQNLVSLLTSDDEAGSELFAWPNPFSWAYVDGVADSSIKNKVKLAGGMVDGVELRVSLSWKNRDDLDLHLVTPFGRIYFGSRQVGGGYLDVDMNVSAPVRGAVENIRFKKIPKDGQYTILVDNYNRRESVDTGCDIEFEILGEVFNFSINGVVGKNQEVAQFWIKDHQLKEVKASGKIIHGSSSKELWEVKTGEFVPVKAITRSPNYWGEQPIGAEHFFFFLEGCKTEEAVRPFFNEFLNKSLKEYRKTFEVLAEKLKVQPGNDQLSGLGFSKGRGQTLTVKADNRLYELQF